MSHVLRHGFQSELVSLVELTSQHTPLIVSWRNDPLIRKWFVSQDSVTPMSHEAWLARRQHSNTDFNWVIEIQGSKPIGAASLYNIDWERKTAEFGRFMIGDRAALGRGYGICSLRMILLLAAAAGIEKVCLEVRSENSHAIAIYERVGFTRHNEGELITMSRPVIGLAYQADGWDCRGRE
jgi:RimJ/RimL family protein N-acetyltransferase